MQIPFRAALLAAIPVFFFYGVIKLAIPSDANPVYSDPGYYYLLNFFRMAVGDAPSYFHHPGIPIQWMGAALVRIKYLLLPEGGGGMVHDFLFYPEHYLDFCGKFVLCLNGIALYLLGDHALKRGLGLPLALFLQAMLLATTPQIWIYSGLVHPEGFAIVFGVLLGICLTSESSKGKIAYTVLAGAALATKLFYAPFLLGNFFVWGKKKGLVACLASVFVFLAFFYTFPPAIRNAAWGNYWRISIRAGAHENGDIGFLSFRELVSLFQTYFFFDQTMFHTLFLLLALSLLGFVFIRLEGKRITGSPLFFTATVTLVSFLFFLRKPYKDYYLFPTIVMLPHIFRETISWQRSALKTGAAVLLVLVTFGLSLEPYRNRLELAKEHGGALLREVTEVGKKVAERKDCYFFLASAVTHRIHALGVGGHAINYTWHEALREIYGDKVFFQASGDRYASFSTGPEGIPFPEIAANFPKENCVLFLTLNISSGGAEAFLERGELLFSGIHRLYYQKNLRIPQ